MCSQLELCHWTSFLLPRCASRFFCIVPKCLALLPRRGGKEDAEIESVPFVTPLLTGEGHWCLERAAGCQEGGSPLPAARHIKNPGSAALYFVLTLHLWLIRHSCSNEQAHCWNVHQSVMAMESHCPCLLVILDFNVPWCTSSSLSIFSWSALRDWKSALIISNLRIGDNIKNKGSSHRRAACGKAYNLYTSLPLYSLAWHTWSKPQVLPSFQEVL